MFEHSFIKDCIIFEDGMAQLPDRPSWGVERDIGAVEKYQTPEQITIKA